jgi:hypothetical protein
MYPWEQPILELVCLRNRSSIIAPPSVVGLSVLSSKRLFIELLPFHALVVLCCQFCQSFCKNHIANLHIIWKRRVAQEEGLLSNLHIEWYWVVVAVCGIL